MSGFDDRGGEGIAVSPLWTREGMRQRPASRCDGCCASELDHVRKVVTARASSPEEAELLLSRLGLLDGPVRAPRREDGTERFRSPLGKARKRNESRKRVAS